MCVKTNHRRRTLTRGWNWNHTRYFKSIYEQETVQPAASFLYMCRSVLLQDRERPCFSTVVWCMPRPQLRSWIAATRVSRVTSAVSVCRLVCSSRRSMRKTKRGKMNSRSQKKMQIRSQNVAVARWLGRHLALLPVSTTLPPFQPETWWRQATHQDDHKRLAQ